MTSFDREAAQKRHESMVIGAAKVALARPELHTDQAVEIYMQGQGLRRAAWATWKARARRRFVRMVDAQLQIYYKAPPPPEE